MPTPDQPRTDSGADSGRSAGSFEPLFRVGVGVPSRVGRAAHRLATGPRGLRRSRAGGNVVGHALFLTLDTYHHHLPSLGSSASTIQVESLNMRRSGIIAITAAVASCAGPGPGVAPAPSPGSTPGPAPASEPATVPEPTPVETAAPLDRPIPYPVVPPGTYQRSVTRGARTADGAPGPDYWQQWVEYDIDARVDVDARTLTGSEVIRYTNASPDRLPILVVNLLQNYHAEGVERVRPAEVTGGMVIERVAYDGQELAPTSSLQTAGWLVEGTLMYVVLPRPVAPFGTAELAIDWSFPLPQAGASARMGYSGDELLHLAYWYPQMAAYDNVIGWHAEPFRGPIRSWPPRWSSAWRRRRRATAGSTRSRTRAPPARPGPPGTAGSAGRSWPTASGTSRSR